MRYKHKFGFMIFALTFTSTALQAEVYTCELNSTWAAKWYDLKYVQIDTTRGNARFGTEKKWHGNYKTKSNKAGIGMLHTWKQELTVTNERKKGRKFTFLNKLRVKNDGNYDMTMSRKARSWELPLACKVN